jgi:hypothetical protein
MQVNLFGAAWPQFGVFDSASPRRRFKDNGGNLAKSRLFEGAEGGAAPKCSNQTDLHLTLIDPI